MFKELREDVSQITNESLEALSLAETLNPIEVIGELMEEGTCLAEKTADIPQGDIEQMLKVADTDDFDKFQFANQDRISGLDEDDLHDMYSPDHRLVGSEVSVEEMVSNLLGENSDVATAHSQSTEADEVGDLEEDEDDFTIKASETDEDIVAALTGDC